MLIEIGGYGRRKPEDELDRHPASFDRLRMRSFLCAMKNPPHPEPVEGRRLVLQWVAIAALTLSLSACGKKSPPELPEGKTDQFPRQYPDPSTL